MTGPLVDVAFWVFAVAAAWFGWRVFRTDSMVRATFALLASFCNVGAILVLLLAEYLGVALFFMMGVEMVVMAIFMVAFMMNPAGLNPMEMVHLPRTAIATGVVAAVALGAVGEPARSALAALRRLAKEQDPHVRWRAVEAIGSLDAPRTQVAELLQRAREDEHPMVRVRAAHASAAIGVRARTCMAVLREAADDGDPNVVRAALDALAQFDGRDQRRAVALLIECLASELADTRRAAANALARVGPAAGDALPELRALAEDSEEEEAVRLAARDAIAAIAVR